MANTLSGGEYITFSKPYLGMVVDSIEQKKPILFKDNKKVVVKQTKEVKEFIKAVKSKNQKNVDSLLKEGKQFKVLFEGYKWSDIVKSQYSGKGGSGGGAEVTALTESLQCFFCSLAINILKRQLTAQDITKSNLEKAGIFCDTDRSLEKCLTNGPSDWMDNGVYITISNAFYKEYKSKIKGNAYFHRGSKFMNGIYEAKSIVHKNDRDSETAQAPGSFSNDKWNPGDIWMSTFPINSFPLKEYTDSWGVLNEAVAKLGGELGGETKLLGISLKKTVNAKVTKYRSPHTKKHAEVKYEGFIFGKNGDFFSSNDMYIKTSSGEMQCRTFGGTTSWQGEIKAKMAAGGKIGGGNVDFYTKKIFGKSIYDTAGNESRLLSKTNVNDIKFMKSFYDLYNTTNRKQIGGVKTKTLSFEEFSAIVTKQSKNFINSKYICLFLAKILTEEPITKNNAFVNELWRYASSDTDQSSFFIKIH